MLGPKNPKTSNGQRLRGSNWLRSIHRRQQVDLCGLSGSFLFTPLLLPNVVQFDSLIRAKKGRPRTGALVTTEWRQWGGKDRLYRSQSEPRPVRTTINNETCDVLLQPHLKSSSSLSGTDYSSVFFHLVLLLLRLLFILLAIASTAALYCESKLTLDDCLHITLCPFNNNAKTSNSQSECQTTAGSVAAVLSSDGRSWPGPWWTLWTRISVNPDLISVNKYTIPIKKLRSYRVGFRAVPPGFDSWVPQISFY